MATDTSELLKHVQDADSFDVPALLWEYLPEPLRGEHVGHVPLPRFETELFGRQLELQLTKFMVLELVAAVLMVLVFVPLAWKIAGGGPPRGRLWNLFEAMLLFLRDEVARPAIGGKQADRFLPYIWTVFFFVLFCNLLGLVPWAGSPTGAWACTLALALMTFGTVVIAGMTRFGLVGFWVGQVPHMDLPLLMAIFVKPMVFFIEILGLGIRHFVLSVRLLANMFAGHLVLAALLGFIALAADRNLALWLGVTLASVLGAVALSLLEILIAFLQAYIFAFLSALFIGMAVHQH
jgi:F-type H+-transporting ATPase subunit a